MKNNEIISEVTVHLKSQDKSILKEKMISCYEDRKSKDQYEWPSCGCVFKNDYRKEVSVPSGLLIDSCGLKSLSVGRAVLSQKHANFIQNRGATSRDILELSLLIREKVWKDLGVWLQYEMEALGHFPSDLEQKMKEKRIENFNQKKIAELQAKFQKKI
jgi:UDP-N-acetylmuramate dehydrogenase